MHVSHQLVSTQWVSAGNASPLQHEGTYGVLDMILILIQVVKINRAGLLMLVCFCVYISYTLPASNPPLPTPARLSSCSHSFFPLLGTHVCQPKVGTSAQFLFAFWLAEHLPPPSRFPLLPLLSYLLLCGVRSPGALVGGMRERQPCLGRGIKARVPVSPPPNSCHGAGGGGWW